MKRALLLAVAIVVVVLLRSRRRVEEWHVAADQPADRDVRRAGESVANQGEDKGP